jgi:hypothetical protein
MSGWSIDPGPFFLDSPPDFVALCRQASGAVVCDIRLNVQACTPPAPPEPQPFWAKSLQDAMEPLTFEWPQPKPKPPTRRRRRAPLAV